MSRREALFLRPTGLAGHAIPIHIGCGGEAISIDFVKNSRIAADAS
jgi:hypothetical protein